jgi:hypothetical protein
VKMTCRVSGGMFAFIVMMGIGLSGGGVRAQERVRGDFSLSQEVHWGRATLPIGNYTYIVDSEGGPAVVRVLQKGGNFSGLFVPDSLSRVPHPGPSGIVLERVGGDVFVVSMHVESLGAELRFSNLDASREVPERGIALVQQPTVSDTPAPEFFTILNPNHETMSPSRAQELYLFACEAVEREFNWSTPIRPRLTLHLGATQNLLRYSNHEVQLKKWNESRFAEGVVELAMRDLASPQMREKLTGLAVNRAAATVNLCELKRCEK